MGDFMFNVARKSLEYQIDLRLEELLEKILQGNVSAAEEAEYRSLVAERSRLMRPSSRPRIARKAA